MLDRIFKEFDPEKHILKHPEAVCPRCESDAIIVLVAKNVVFSCLDCRTVEELPITTD